MKLTPPRIYKVLSTLNHRSKSSLHVVDMVYIEKKPMLVFEWIEKNGEDIPKLLFPVSDEDLEEIKSKMYGADLLLKKPVPLNDSLADIVLGNDQPPLT